MQFRSIISVFMVVCLIVVALFSDATEGGKVLQNTNQNSIYPNKNNFVQRLRRKARNTYRRSKRDDGYDTDGSNIKSFPANDYGNNGVNPSGDNGNNGVNFGGDNGNIGLNPSGDNGNNPGDQSQVQFSNQNQPDYSQGQGQQYGDQS